MGGGHLSCDNHHGPHGLGADSEPSRGLPWGDAGVSFCTRMGPSALVLQTGSVACPAAQGSPWESGEARPAVGPRSLPSSLPADCRWVQRRRGPPSECTDRRGREPGLLLAVCWPQRNSCPLPCSSDTVPEDLWGCVLECCPPSVSRLV